ncbi:hypothetical protein AVEN_202752-1 [Araneus ventricosus]|uniref:Uncharacterized protein n=1 Tax=Araneus ventricosus TaxID=182803 RepID=A0A4Y2L0L6_ARAVE|nr:hypothetical protein AVEN_202752-1 [Araneus ventricosus]
MDVVPSPPPWNEGGKKGGYGGDMQARRFIYLQTPNNSMISFLIGNMASLQCVKPAIHFTDKLYILERGKEKRDKNLWKWAKQLAMAGIPSGVKSERKI